MTLTPDTRLGAYEILSLLGRGGMGEVYRARDTTLGREVAIKMLPPELASDQDRLARLGREAKLLAALNHPHIAAIYSLEQIGDRPVLVMELVPGQTLADRLASGPMPLREMLLIAVQIAQALEAAHAKGIIHRDLKPANIKLTPDHNVKLLDFGLAKPSDEDASAIGELSASPTMAGATAAGIIMGTAPYMSPEQARGKRIDSRTDVWAFGCVAFEMLTGAKAFPGETVTDTVAAIVRAEPNWPTLPSSTPPAIRSLLRRCLQKEPASRLHHIADARLELEDAIAEPSHERDALPADRPRARWTRVLPWALAAVMAAALAGLSAFPRRAASPNRGVTRLDMNLPPGVELYTLSGQDLAMSPDGTRIAFVGVASGVRQVYVRALDEFQAVPLRGADNVNSCFFSHDGRSIGFLSADGAVRKVSLADGSVVTVTRDAQFSYGAAWGSDDRIVFVRSGTLWHVPASGGTPKQLTTLDAARHEAVHAWPTVLPGAEAILFSSTAARRDAARIESLVLATGERKTLVDRGTLPLYAPTGHLLFFRDGELLAAPFDAARVVLTGPPVRVLSDLPTGGEDTALLAVSATGALVYAPTTATGRLVWVSREGVEQPLNDTPRNYTNPRLAPDGSRLVVQAKDLWLQDLRRATFTRLTSGEAAATGFPVWTPDGRRIVFRTTLGMRWLDVDGSGRGEDIQVTSPSDYPGSISADGDTVLIMRSSADSSFDIYAISMKGAFAARPVVRTPAYEGGTRLSPDGQWISYISNETGQMEVYVRPFPGPDRKWQVSTQGGTQAVWNPHGKELFYRSGNKMMVVEVTTKPDLALSQPRVLFEQPYAFGGGITLPNYDVSPDGQRFVMVKEELRAARLNVMLDWFEELKARVPVSK